MTYDEWVRLGMTFDDWLAIGKANGYCEESDADGSWTIPARMEGISND